ncbi:hypothetical protein [Mesorhizobium sp. L-8-3]|uniref:hypothetical protein n=1 Tax=Mesorhizobium sp. L-8-3 TaxID=2744522 RepID=UPI00192562E9|nr:hypothetical protein [Mesorhizobium sp. L-8-3]BCH21739.1 hypothetical protein MesoLjLb_15240 [Mesorhizobium sp. L-8-3]
MKSWTEKFNAPARVEIKPVPMSIAGMKAGEIMLVPTPKLVDEFMRSIPRGSHVDVKAMRKMLAERHDTEVTCPIYTGYHLRTVAEAAHEALERGAPLEDITPFWRVLDAATPTTGRLSFGAEFVHQRRREEGLPA